MPDQWLWWKHGVIYQIYPRSFYDADGDGTGDLRGIIEKLDYLEYLGVDALWLSPVFRSPMYDFGYDISDFRRVDPLFGTDGDMDRLISRAHRKNIRIVLDMVINHTSHQHIWFVKSRSSRSSPNRDWYIWCDESRGGPPNNWRAAFGGSAWEWDRETGQYYLHSFLKEQPDVNWRNDGLKNAMFGEMRYWLDRGVDGFRLDVVNWYVKDRKLRSNPYIVGLSYAPRPYDLQDHLYDRNRGRTHAILREMRAVMDSYPERMLVGEVFSPPPGDSALSSSYLGSGGDELHLAFDFSLLYARWGARRFMKRVREWISLIPEGGWPCHVLSNHDQPRAVSRYGSCGRGESLARAKVAAVLLLTLRGTPFLYYGEEIGMRQGRIRKKDIRDPAGLRYWPFYRGRDGARTPMQWTPERYGGFSTARPWLPVNPDSTYRNVELQYSNPSSLLTFYRDLIKLRKARNALHRGEWVPVRTGRGVMGYCRVDGDERLLVLLNFSRRKRKAGVKEPGAGRVLLSTHRSPGENLCPAALALRPHEAVILEWEKRDGV